MKFCKKCVTMVFRRSKLEYIVVVPPRRDVIRKFDDFNKAREFARTYSSTARVEERETGTECVNCGGDI